MAKLLPRETLIRFIRSTAQWKRNDDAALSEMGEKFNDVYSRQLCAASERVAYRLVNSGLRHPTKTSSRILWKPIFVSDESEMLYLMKYKGREHFE
jgi:hypothetical protein